jgi:hypothetical protein
MDAVDLSEATFWGVSFSGKLDLTQAVLPRDGEHFLYDAWKARLRKLGEKSSPNQGIEAQVRRFIKVLEPFDDQEQYLVNRQDLIKTFGHEATQFVLAGLGAPIASTRRNPAS